MSSIIYNNESELDMDQYCQLLYILERSEGGLYMRAKSHGDLMNPEDIVGFLSAEQLMKNIRNITHGKCENGKYIP